MRRIPWEEEDGRDSEKSNGEMPDLNGLFLVTRGRWRALQPGSAARPHRIRPIPCIRLLSFWMPREKSSSRGGRSPTDPNLRPVPFSSFYCRAQFAGASAKKYQLVFPAIMRAGKANWSSEAFEPDGMMKREWIRIAKPSTSNCGTLPRVDRHPGRPGVDTRGLSGRSLPAGRQELERVPIDPFRRFDIFRPGGRDLFSQFVRQTRSPFPLGCSRPKIVAVHRLPFRSQ